MLLPIINNDDANHGSEILKHYYANKMIPAEKKTYMTKLRDSQGPYMGIESSDGSTHYLLDAASQIATMGHGFNPSMFFGTTEFIETWMNDSTTKEFKDMRIAFLHFLKRKLNWKKASMTLVHSGAEANETALGYCYRSRIHKEANKVLAFEGSFHGRMMITLAATWNKSKREPFEWKNYLAEYVKYPELNDSQINVAMPSGWREVWNESSVNDFHIPAGWTDDSMIKKEVEALLNIRTQLQSRKIFAILIEPMQCEGGDCYSSDRFHTALLLMARTYKVPVIHDEVQTGFHLGKEFFWHRQFNLRGLSGEQLNPDYVICAKKAQLGIVLSHKETKNIFIGEEFSVASAFRGYAHALSLDQCQSRIQEMEALVIPRINKLLKKHEKFISRPRLNGLAFAFDLHDPALLNKFVDLRFKHGLLYYPAGNQTLRFRLNTSFGEKDLDFLFERLDYICRELFLNEHHPVPTHVDTDTTSAAENYEWHELLISAKLEKLQGKAINSKDIFQKVEKLMTQKSEIKLIQISADNFLNYRQEIIDLQKKVYEPARQTDIEKFEHTVLNKNSICLGILSREKKLLGIAFAGPLKLYPLERGVRMDPHFNDEGSLYMLDVTIDTSLQRSGLGRSLKYALSAMALTKGIKRIQGRNRDRLAAAMININLSLGAIEQNYIPEDYPDFEDYRDVLYYTSKADWTRPKIHLARAVNIPLSVKSLTKDYFDLQMPFAVNKVCLSNFVSETFLKGIKEVINTLPVHLRHGYTCSGQSESVDKVAKTIWVKSAPEVKEKHITKMMTFKNHYFGNGSALARSLSIEADPYFEVTKLANPSENNYGEILKLVEAEFSTGKYLAVWIEPVLQKTMDKMPLEFLKGMRTLSTKYKVALVFNETASQFYRFSHSHFFASSNTEIAPDAGLIYFSGQSAMAFASDNYYLEQPLMMISTWDGDEFSFNTYHHAFTNVLKNEKDYKETTIQFHEKLIAHLSRYEIELIKLEKGFGYFKGSIPASMSKMFVYHGDRYIVCPSYDAMKEYINS
ncbi:MAG: aminotransferase class III-fold pyridoxal phosphate-dependent enzyme [Bacteriovorax sp.]|jgi:acetylornithine/succinyldiaminopimelate/putrescine aminotransferase